MTTTNNSLRSRERAWVKCSRRDNLCKLRLFCFPYAGGRSQVFRKWADTFSNGIEAVPIYLPGENIRETCIGDMAELVQALAEGLEPYLDKPFAFFGHSMGALIAFEVLRFLQHKRRLRAEHIFVSASPAPTVPNTRRHIHALPNLELFAQLRLLNGTPPEILDSEELIEILLPRIRADFKLNETYSYQEGPLLECGMTAYCGIEDAEVLPEAMLEWRRQTGGNFTLKLMPGDHFFMHTQHTELLKHISDSLILVG